MPKTDFVVLREAKNLPTGVKSLKLHADKANAIKQKVSLVTTGDEIEQILKVTNVETRTKMVRAHSSIRGILPRVPNDVLRHQYPDGDHPISELFKEDHFEVVKWLESKRPTITKDNPLDQYEFFDLVYDLIQENKRLSNDVAGSGPDGDAAYFCPPLGSDMTNMALSLGKPFSNLTLQEAINIARVDEETIMEWLRKKQLRRYRYGFNLEEIQEVCILNGALLVRPIRGIAERKEQGGVSAYTFELGFIINHVHHVRTDHHVSYIPSGDVLILDPIILWGESAAELKAMYPEFTRAF